jgi:glycosyltransferase involved in cell wall biosynthesis
MFIGLDLPMKVVDMFGCSIPVLAKRFPAIGELVIDGVNGRLFDKESDLKQSLIELATGFPNFSEVFYFYQSLKKPNYGIFFNRMNKNGDGTTKTT